MRRTALVVAALSLLATSCARPAAYWTNRWWDLADCFTLEVGHGEGMGVEVGASDWFALAAGSADSRKYGFVGRHRVGPAYGNNKDSLVGLFPFTTVLDSLCSEECSHDGYALLMPGIVFLGSAQARHEGASASPDTCHPATARRWSASILGINVTALAENNRGRDAPLKLADSFDVDFGATLEPVSARVGFRFGQLLDFLLGWTTLDIAGDDEAGQPPPPPPTPQPLQKDAKQ